jgi:hypothetical protein
VAVARHDHLVARSEFEVALARSRRSDGDEWLLAHVLAALAPLMAMSGDPRDAQRLADEAVTISRGFTQRAVLAMAIARAAETAILTADLDRADTLLRELLTLLPALGTRRWAADALEMAAVVLERREMAAPAVSALAGAQALRLAAGEGSATVRAVAVEVHRTADRLRTSVSSREHAAREHAAWALSCEDVMEATLKALASRGRKSPVGQP